MLCGLFRCVSPATDWQPIQGVSCLLLSDSQVGSSPPATLNWRSGREWMDILCIQRGTAYITCEHCKFFVCKNVVKYFKVYCKLHSFVKVLCMLRFLFSLELEPIRTETGGWKYCLILSPGDST